MSKKSILIRALIAAVLWLIFVAAALGIWAWHWLTTAQSISEEKRLVAISSGESLSGLARQLEQQGLLTCPKLWLAYARLSNQAWVNAGEFELAQRESPLSMLKRFQSSAVIQYSVTFVEGMTAKQAIAELAGKKKLRQTISADFRSDDISSLALDASLNFDYPNLEGWVFPDTYSFIAGDSDLSIVQRAVKKMQSELEQQWQNRAENLPYKNSYEALIMASIVEKETGAPHERQQIAGVFVRRLEKGMRLQTDPTVIYGMGDHYKGNITRADLRRATPYNTYTIRGLPPTPIALPGRAAIHAALHPDDGDALYFVARGDGTHQFSATLDEHNRAVREYQLKRKAGYRSNYQGATSE
ncbi:endolytic transglycosylase MltG [Agaribacterium haliotis]|uniref:endolytic transglycosylase MltG n=1 Tax=Agaribacterium haliotis TaxID=2013869 RepID=UPI001EFD9830|nr:endolytic transglycosylase MltG [Agaribacterium haliotis]